MVSIAPSIGNRLYEMKVHGKNVLNTAPADSGDFRQNVGSEGIPFLAIIAPDGTVRHVGLHPGDPEADVAGKIEAILREFKLPVPAKS